jgi:transmembrane sensor
MGCTVVAALALLYVERKDLATDTSSAGVVHSTAVGEVRHLDLQGGSRVDLNTGSEIRTRVDSDGRVVVLTRGEARFRVERNDRVAFFVLAGDARMRTADADFSVRLVNRSQIDVVVKSGRVDISVATPGAPAANFRLSPPISVTASSDEAISLRSGVVYARQRLSPAAVERRTAWTDGWIWFSAEPLPQAVAEFNRYHEQQLVLVDPRLASLEVGGRFRSTDLDSFIATLEHSFDVRTAAATLPGTRAATIYLTERCSRASQQCN